METKTMIQAQANVLKITAVRKGDVLKVVEDSNYSSPSIKYAVVIDLLNSGTKSYIQLLQYDKSYNGVTAEIKTYSGETDLSLFPASLEDVKTFFGDAVKSLSEKIEKSKKELFDQEEGLKKAQEFVSGELSKKLTVASFSEISQVKFDERKKELEQL